MTEDRRLTVVRADGVERLAVVGREGLGDAGGSPNSLNFGAVYLLLLPNVDHSLGDASWEMRSIRRREGPDSLSNACP